MTSTGRAARVGLVIAGLFAALACETVEEPFPSQSALDVDVTFSALGSQLAPMPVPQVVLWSIDEASASQITGFEGEYSFLRSSPCFYPLNITSIPPLTLDRACRVSGLTLTQGVPRTAVLRFRISSMELRQAARPDLRAGVDPDGDGIANGVDNCTIIPNPEQATDEDNADVIGDGVGDACSILDATKTPTIPDSDLDGVPNAVDNCLWYRNPLLEGEESQPDSDRDRIGDACARVAPVILPAQGLTLTCSVEFTTRASIPSLFRLDFAREGVLTCDSGFTGCAIDPSKLQVQLAGTTETFPCTVVP